MALSTYPAVSSPVKSVQRGSAAGAGTVTITAIDITKSMVHVFGTASSGTVSASFGMSMNSGTVAIVGPVSWQGPSNYTKYRPTGASVIGGDSAGGYPGQNTAWSVASTVNAGNAVVNAGSNNLVSAVVQGYLSGSTSLVVSGACRWEVVEFN